MKHLFGLLVALIVSLCLLSACIPPGASGLFAQPASPQPYPASPSGSSQMAGGIVVATEHYKYDQPVSRVTMYNAQGSAQALLSFPQGNIVVDGGITMDANQNLFITTGYTGNHGSNDEAVAYVYEPPYGNQVELGVTDRVVVDEGVTMCAQSPSTVYLENAGIDKKTEKLNHYVVDSYLFTGGPHWKQAVLQHGREWQYPNLEVSGSRDQYGNCFLPGYKHIGEFAAASPAPINTIDYVGSDIEAKAGHHRMLAVGPQQIFVGNDRELIVYNVKGLGEAPQRAYVIKNPWPQAYHHEADALVHLAVDGNGTLYLAHPHYEHCGAFDACWYDTSIWEYKYGSAVPFLRARFPHNCFPGPDCLVNIVAGSTGNLFVQVGQKTLYEYQSGHTTPDVTIKTKDTISALYAP